MPEDIGAILIEQYMPAPEQFNMFSIPVLMVPLGSRASGAVGLLPASLATFRPGMLSQRPPPQTQPAAERWLRVNVRGSEPVHVSRDVGRAKHDAARLQDPAPLVIRSLPSRARRSSATPSSAGTPDAMQADVMLRYSSPPHRHEIRSSKEDPCWLTEIWSDW